MNVKRIAALFILLLVWVSSASGFFGSQLKTASGDFFSEIPDCVGFDAPGAHSLCRENGCYVYETASDVRKGPNVYTYVVQNPWTKFDPLGLWETNSYWGDVGQVFKGYGNAAVNTAKGMGHVVAHPIQTAQGVGQAVSHPLQTFNAIKADVRTKLQTNAGTGEIFGDVLIGVASGGALKAASKTGTFAKIAEKLNVRNKAAVTSNVVDSAADLSKSQSILLNNEYGKLMGSYDANNLSLKVNSIESGLTGENYGTKLYQQAIDSASGDVKVVEGLAGGTNQSVINATGDITKTPRAKSLTQLGFDKHTYDPETKIMKAEITEQ